MPKPTKIESADLWDSETRLLAWLATCVAVIAFLFYYRQGEILLYGDAVAHINIARRVFDSKTPGLLQLGTVWLPLPHLLMIPFLISIRMWQTGAGGSIPSMVGYVFGVIGIFRLTRGVLLRGKESEPAARLAAWTAALVYAANPNLIYMQSTAMGESLYLAFFIWAVVYGAESTCGDARALAKCGFCLAAACLTRYDGWFLAATMAAVIVGRFLLNRRGDTAFAVPAAAPRENAASAGGAVPGGSAVSGGHPASGGREVFGGSAGSRGRAALQGRVSAPDSGRALAPGAVIKFLLIAAAAPALWLAYNGLIYRNPLEFENGPYSAKAIERKTENAGNPGHPGSGNPILATRYFLKSAEDNVAHNEWLQRAWLLLVFAALFAAAWDFRRPKSQTAQPIYSWPLLFLLIPLPFYALSIAYGGVPIFIPQFWPFTHYNVRYGLQLLPTFSVALALLIYIPLRSAHWNDRLRLGGVLVILALVATSYASIWNATPLCLEEAQVNMRTRNQLQSEIAQWLKRLPNDSTLLMYLGDHVGALERAGIPLRRTINEGNHRVWAQPSDPQGLWERALSNPPQYADYVLAFEGDPVWQAVHDLHMRALVEIHVSGQARAILYRAR